MIKNVHFNVDIYKKILPTERFFLFTELDNTLIAFIVHII